MGYGIKVSQKGYDVFTAAPQELVVSSDMPSLKVFSVTHVSTTIPASGAADNRIRVTHNLGYFAPCFVIYNGSTTIGTNKSFMFSDNVLPLTVEVYPNYLEIVVDEFFDQGFSNNGDTVYFTVYQFVDDFSAFTSAVASATTQTGGNDDYGIKISKQGYDVLICTDEQLCMHSKYGCANVHMKGSTTASSITHNLGYVSQALAFIQESGTSYLQYFKWIGYDANAAHFYLNPGDIVYYVIFK